MHLKIFYQGSLFIEDQLIIVKTYIENSLFTLEAELGKGKQKLSMEIETYRAFFKEKLLSDHANIIKFLTFNGKYLELKGCKGVKETIEVE